MQSLATLIEDALRTHNTEVQLFPRITMDDVYMAIRQVMRDNPDIFWFSHQWHYSQEKATVNLRYTIDKERSEKIKAQINDVVQNDFKLSYAHTLSVREQVMYVYKWIALYCNYTIHSAHNQTIYSVFVHRHSVCTGIAKAAQYLLKLLSIESRLVFGRMNKSEKNSRHCWLIVNIEEQWYHLDPTFALPETEHLLHQCGVTPAKGKDFLFYNFFCVDTETIKQSRAIEEEELLPKCTNKIDHRILQQIKVAPSRNGDPSGLGCVLSNSGTTADIYIAHNEDKYHRHRTVAKVFRDDDEHELLRKELIVMRECAGSPHILRATYADFSKGILYMEQATPLSELLASHYYKLTLKCFCNLLIDIASGLKELLNHGIFYRDIHLNNIYLSEDSLSGKLTYKLGDFGSCTFVEKDGKFAGLTGRGGVGSKWYMALETWNEEVFDERSAVYGVGMIAYYLLNDLYPPFWQEYGEGSLGFRMKSHRLPIPSILQKEGFAQLRMDFVFKSLSYNPSERFQTLGKLIDSIKECKSVNQDKLIIVGSEFNEVAKKPLTEVFCSTCGVNPSIIVSNGESPEDMDAYSQISDFAETCGGSWNNPEKNRLQNKSTETFFPCDNNRLSDNSMGSEACDSPESPKGLFARIKDLLFGKSDNHSPANINTRTTVEEMVNSSIFAPSETKRGDYMMVQVFLYKDDEARAVACKAAEVDPDAHRQNYTPLSVKLKDGDRVKAKLTMSCKGIDIDEPIQEMIWQGHYTDCQFGVYVPEDYKPSSMMGTVILTVNDIPCGRMMFKTKIVNQPQKLYAKIESKAFKKIFISYSHKDESTVKYFAKAFQAQGVDYFFDRHYLKAGDVYPLKIKEYINSADLFILCWSKNAAESDYVRLERQQALTLAFPQKDMEHATLSIHPISIEPHADYPSDMQEVYNFEEI